MDDAADTHVSCEHLELRISEIKEANKLRRRAAWQTIRLSTNSQHGSDITFRLIGLDGPPIHSDTRARMDPSQ